MTGNPPVPLPTPFHQLSSLLEAQSESFISGNKEIQDVALRATEHVFNIAIDSEKQAQPYISAFLASLSPAQAPVTRSQSSANGKRKRSPTPTLAPKHALQRTPLTCLYVEDLDKDQIWAQLELRAQLVCKMLECALDGPEEPTEISIAPTTTTDIDQSPSDEDETDSSYRESEGDSEMPEEAGSSSGEEMEEGVAELRGESADEEEEEWPEKPRFLPPSPAKTKGSYSGLNDSFFDLAEFNVETMEAEAVFVSNGALDTDSDGASSAEDEIDYFASTGERLQGDTGHELYYSDLFDAPKCEAARKKTGDRPFAKAHSKVRFHDEVKVKTIKARGKGLALSVMRLLDDASDEDSYETESEDESESDLESTQDHVFDGGGGKESQTDDDSREGNFPFDGHQTIKRSQDDLLADEDEPDDGMSTHEKRLASLQQQIAALEAENIAEKHWTLAGEATSRIRPHNSLLEEDLEFERVTKAVPVITEETVSGLEDRIKARILEGRFDDVMRKRPVDDKPFLPSRFFELQDTKSKQSLAQIYEEEYAATQTGDVAGDRDGKLKSEHEEITRIWEVISSKLDALSNVHFTPKAPKATISTVANVASTSLESALPTSNTFASMLAPEEIYERSAVDPRAPGELTPNEKRASRNKLKKAKKRARETLESSVGKFARTKGAGGIKATVVKSGKGVTVVGKKQSKKR